MLLVAAALFLQDPAAQDQYIEPATDLRFPLDVGELKRNKVSGYDDPGLGVSIEYLMSGTMTVTVYVYNLGLKEIAAGIGSEEIKAQFKEAKGGIYTFQKRGRYRDVKESADAEASFGGKEPVKWIQSTFELTLEENGPVHQSRIYLTVHKNQFLKVRATFPDADKDKCEKSLTALFEALAAQMKK
jgi:hypothetical protein